MNLHHMLRAAAGYSVPAPPASTDPQFNYVTMLLHGDGTNGAQNNTFVDSSTNNFTITRNGTPTQGSFSPYGDLWSNYFNGSTDRLGISHNTALDLSTGSWTIEGWMYVTSGTYYRTMVAKRVASGATCEWEFGVSNSNTLYFYRTGTAVNGSTTVPSNTWVHAAVTYDGTNLRMFQNGTVVYTQSGLTAASGTNNVTVGNYGASGDQPWFGSISNLRVVKGTALYTSNFTPSTTPLTAVSGTSLLTCQSNRFRDNSSNNFAITVTGTPSVQRFSPFDPAAEYSTSVIGGSGQFSSNTSYLTAASNAAFAFPGEFTVEGWFYWTTIPSAGQITGVLASGGFNITYNTTLQFNLFGTGAIASATFTPVVGRWYHIAMTRNASNLCTVWIDGVSSATGTSSASFVQGAWSLYGGSNNGGAGYVSNLRVVKGTAVYTANFTPPTAPLTAITNTSLLLNFTNAGIFDNAMMNDLVTVGNAQISTSVKKYGTGSMAFDGSGDYLTIPNSVNLTFGTGDFTVEAWVNLNVLGSDRSVIDFRSSTNSFGALYISGSGNRISFYDGTVTSSGTALTAGSWNHVAWVRVGTTLYGYLNGVQQWSRTLSTNITTIGSPKVGADYNGSLSQMNGYIDDLRITKGYARYTANFTPPTAAFPNN
jgi:hypothetical protein